MSIDEKAFAAAKEAFWTPRKNISWWGHENFNNDLRIAVEAYEAAKTEQPGELAELKSRLYHAELDAKGYKANWENSEACREAERRKFREEMAARPVRESGNALRKALERLITLKLYKDVYGKDEFYEKEQPEAWAEAKAALAKTDIEGGA